MTKQTIIKQLLEDIQKLTSGQSFDFLKDEEDLYTKSDLKETYTTRASLDFHHTFDRLSV